MSISPEHLQELAEAKLLLENPGLPARMTDVVGRPIEMAIHMLPDAAQKMIAGATQKALTVALDVALSTVDTEAKGSASSPWWHKAAAIGSGAVGGFFGELALPIELPISTGIMLRSIGDIAREKGEDLVDVESRLACIEIFALGGKSSKDDGAETGYFAVRAALAQTLRDAATHLAGRKLADKGAPVVVQFISKVASRFAIPVSQKAVAQMLPIVGGAAGALINLAFIDHFQDIARGHFTVRNLERAYGVVVVREAYELLPMRRPGK